MKKVFVFSALSLTALFLFAKRKIGEAQELVSALDVRLSRVNSVKFRNNTIFLNVDIALINKSNYSFSVNTSSLLSIENIFLHKSDNSLLAEASTNISNINISPLSETVIENIEIKGNVLTAISEYITTGFKDDYKTRLKVKVFGKKWLIP